MNPSLHSHWYLKYDGKVSSHPHSESDMAGLSTIKARLSVLVKNTTGTETTGHSCDQNKSSNKGKLKRTS